MTVFQSIVLGLVQGIAEFLPISSSGHLKIAQTLLGVGDVPLLFDIFLHLATLLAVVLYFRRVIVRLFAVLFRWALQKEEPEPRGAEHDQKIATLAPNDRAGRNTIVMVLVTTAVTGVLGVAGAKIVPDLPIRAVCVGFLVTAGLLIASAVFERKFRRTDESGAIVLSGITMPQALVVGLMQGIGTLPGISRSGSTIAGALFCKMDRMTAGDYSFIVSIPAIVGAFVLELKDVGDVSSSVGAVPVLCGGLAAFVSGCVALRVLMRLIGKGKLEFFACYLIPVSIALMVLF